MMQIALFIILITANMLLALIQKDVNFAVVYLSCAILNSALLNNALHS